MCISSEIPKTVCTSCQCFPAVKRTLASGGLQPQCCTVVPRSHSQHRQSVGILPMEQLDLATKKREHTVNYIPVLKVGRARGVADISCPNPHKKVFIKWHSIHVDIYRIKNTFIFVKTCMHYCKMQQKTCDMNMLLKNLNTLPDAQLPTSVLTKSQIPFVHGHYSSKSITDVA